jgi:hypothetical protein
MRDRAMFNRNGNASKRLRKGEELWTGRKRTWGDRFFRWRGLVARVERRHSRVFVVIPAKELVKELRLWGWHDSLS